MGAQQKITPTWLAYEEDPDETRVDVLLRVLAVGVEGPGDAGVIPLGRSGGLRDFPFVLVHVAWGDLVSALVFLAFVHSACGGIRDTDSSKGKGTLASKSQCSLRQPGWLVG